MAKKPRVYCAVDKRDWIDVHLDCDHVEVEMCVEGQRGSVCLTSRQARTLISMISKQEKKLR